MALSFVGWGISSDLFRLMGPPSWIAKIGGQTIEIPAFQSEFQRAMAQQPRDLPSDQEPSAAVRPPVGQQTLDRLVAQAASAQELNKLRIVTPDDAVAAVARSMPAFQGRSGQFSKARSTAVLRNNGYTEARFLAQLRADIAQRQLLTSVSAGSAPAAEVTPLYKVRVREARRRHRLLPAIRGAGAGHPGPGHAAALV